MKKNLLSAVLLTSAMAGTALTSCTDTEVPGGGNNSGTKGDFVIASSVTASRRCVVMHDAPLFCSSLYKSVHFL